MRKRNRKQSGLSVLEVAVATVGAAVVLTAAGVGLDSAFSVWGDSVATTSKSSRARSVLDGIVSELEDASPESIADSLEGPIGSPSITFRRRIGYSEGQDELGPAITYRWERDPKDPEDQRDNDGDGLVDEGRIVRVLGDAAKVIAEDVPALEYSADAICSSVPGDGNFIEGRTGLSFVLIKSKLKVRMTTAVPKKKKNVVRHRTKRATVRLEN